MLDLRFIRENPELVQEAARKKHLDFQVEELLQVDSRRVASLAEVEKLRAEQNKLSAERTAPREQLRQLKTDLQEKEKALAEVVKEWQKLMLLVPNIPDVSVPEGEGPEQNLEIRRSGQPPPFSFPVKNHLELMEELALVDFERGVKIAGFRGYVLKNEAVRLCLALWRYTFDYFTQAGFTPLLVPSLLKKEPFLGTAFLPQGAADLYKTEDNLYLSGTAEVAVMGYFADEIFDREALPLKIIAFSPCFRREAGSYGKESKGLFRVHEFFKWEQVVLAEASHEAGVKYHEELTAHGEKIVQGLGLPYRIVLNCGGDLGLGQVKKYDLEVWFPSEGRFRETHSASYYHDFQTRRLNIRYREKENEKPRFAHSLNNTALATPRLLAALLENYQQAEGTIKVPEILVPYFGKKVIERADGQSGRS